MKKILIRYGAGAVLALLLGTGATAQTLPAPVAVSDADAMAQSFADTLYIQQHYAKTEYRIPARDGVKLYTVVYTPKDADRVRYPIMLNRTPYSVGPYGPGTYKSAISPSSAMLHEGYIFAFQDVRGRYMSEGQFLDMRPQKEQHAGKTDTDESTDTFDTIEFLLKHGAKSNGRVGQWGISYPGYYTSTGLLSRHPALKAASPQAPIADWFWDDFHHNGAFFLPHSFNFLSSFGLPRPVPTAVKNPAFQHGTPDGYDFFLKMGPLKNADARYLKGQVAFLERLGAAPRLRRLLAGPQPAAALAQHQNGRAHRGRLQRRRGPVWGFEHLPIPRKAKPRHPQPPHDGPLDTRRLGPRHRRNAGQRGLRPVALALVPGKRGSAVLQNLPERRQARRPQHRRSHRV